MITIRINTPQVQSALARIERAALDLRPTLRAIATEMISQTEANFAAEGRPQWQPLAPATITRREKQGTWPGKILQVTAGGLATDISTETGSTFVRIGSAKEYAAIQQLGGDAGRGLKTHIPARPFLPFTGGADSSGTLQPEAEEAILDIAQEHLRRAAGV
jgi:phage virion morphogenesis protein